MNNQHPLSVFFRKYRDQLDKHTTHINRAKALSQKAVLQKDRIKDIALGNLVAEFMELTESLIRDFIVINDFMRELVKEEQIINLLEKKEVVEDESDE